MANLHTLLRSKIGIHLDCWSRLICTGNCRLSAAEGRGCVCVGWGGLWLGLAGVGGGGRWPDKEWTRWKDATPRRLSCIPTCLKKLTLIERGGEISRSRFKVRDKPHKVKSHEAPADGGNGNPYTPFWQVTGLMIAEEKCTRLKKQMNYDSFHIKQTYLRKRALGAASTSTDSITNWPANHLTAASKVQIRYLRSQKEDSAVCSLPSLPLSQPCFALKPENQRFGLFFFFS